MAFGATIVLAAGHALRPTVAGRSGQNQAASDEATGPGSPPPLDPGAGAAIAPLLDYLGDSVDEHLAMRGVLAWPAVFGLVSFELFGQLHNVVDPSGREGFFRAEVDRLGHMVGFGRGDGAKSAG